MGIQTAEILMICLAGIFFVDLIYRFAIHYLVEEIFHGAFILNSLGHHTLTIILITTTIISRDQEIYLILFKLLAVEFNTCAHNIRRIVTRGTLLYKFVNFVFLISWFATRIF